MSDIYKGGMTHERFLQLSAPGFEGNLTDAESDAGWHFCHMGWDGMLIHLTDDEMEFCECPFHTDWHDDRANAARQRLRARNGGQQ